MKALKSSAIYVVGEVLSKAISFVLLPYVSRKMGPEAYGELSYYQTCATFFGVILAMNQGAAISRYFYFYGKRSLNLIVNTGYAYTSIVALLMLFFCWIFRSEVMVYIVISSWISTLLSVQLGIRQFQKRAYSYVTIQLVLTVSMALGTIITLSIYETDLAVKRIIATMFANIFVFFVAYFFYFRERRDTIYKKFSFKQYKIAFFYIMGYGLPLIFHNLSGFLKGHIDKVFIFHKYSQYDLGIYSMGLNLASVWSMLILAFNKSLVPYYFEGLKNNTITLKKVHRWSLISLLLSPIPMIVMWMIPQEFITWLLGEKFNGTKPYIALFLMSFSLTIPYLFLVNYLFYYAKNKVISTCSIISTGFYLISLWLLSNTNIHYIPFAAIIASLSILPILYFMTLKVKKNDRS